MSSPIAAGEIARPGEAAAQRLTRSLRFALIGALALVGIAAIYLWVVRGGLILFDVSAVFCL